MTSTNVKQSTTTCRYHGHSGCKICAKLPKKLAALLRLTELF
jgi:hypothetical protein